MVPVLQSVSTEQPPELDEREDLRVGVLQGVHACLQEWRGGFYFWKSSGESANASDAALN